MFKFFGKVGGATLAISSIAKLQGCSKGSL